MKRKLLLSLALCLALFSTAACAAKRSYESTETAYDMAAPPAEAPMALMATEEAGYGASGMSANSAAKAAGQSAAPADAAVRKIIYNANMDVTADDPAAALQAVIDKAAALGGYVSNSYTTNDDEGAAQCNVTLKVPAEQLDALVGAAKGLGKVNDYRLYSDDISQQYYDIDARLTNAKSEEKQLLAILEQCETVEDILAVRESLTSVRSDIESYQAQINLWDNLVGYATLDMSIRRTPKSADSAGNDLLAIWKAGDVFEDMGRWFQNSARFMVNAVSAVGIFLAAAIIPATVLFLCIGLPIILHKRNKKKRAAKSAATQPAEATAQSAQSSNESQAELDASSSEKREPAGR